MVLVLGGVVLLSALPGSGHPADGRGGRAAELLLLPFRVLGRLFGWSWPRRSLLVVRGAGKHKARCTCRNGPWLAGEHCPGNW